MEYKTYKYTIKTIAEQTGLKEWKIRRDARNGVFSPSSLLSVAAYVVRVYLDPKDLK